MEISERTSSLGIENAFSVLADVEELRRQGKRVLNFCIGQPDYDTPEHVKEAAIDAIRKGKTGYTPSNGILELRKAVADYLSSTRDIDVKPDSVVVGNGSKPFIGYVILAVTDYGRGDEVIYPNPGYPVYESQIRAHGAVPVPLHLREENNYDIDTDELAEKLSDKTRLLILNSPHNPTGGVTSQRTLKRIAEILEGNDKVWVSSDEVYSRIQYEDRFASIASFPGMTDRTIIVDAVSKTYAMTGWRIGYASNRILAPHLSRWVNNTDSCAGHPNQYAALAALTGPQEESSRMVASFRRRRDLAVKGLASIEGVKCTVPKGAFYVWPNVTEACRHVGAHGSEDFRRQLLHGAGVAVLSDAHFGGADDKAEGEHIRLSYAASDEDIKEGLERIRQFIEKNRIAEPLVT
jgi:aspartate/methionine/tyrosine aminotransferase